jgi:hypothetical protein
MSSFNPEQGTLFDMKAAPQGSRAIPIGLRAEGLSKVMGYYNNIGRTNVPETKVRLGKVAAQVFSKTFGVRELVESGIDEDIAVRMADDFYFGWNQTGYNTEGRSFLKSYAGKVNRPRRKNFQQALGAEINIYPTEIPTHQTGQQPQSSIRTVLDEGKVILPKHSEVVQAGTYHGVDAEDRITLGRLIRLAGEGIDEPWPHEEPSVPFIKSGLYIPPSDPRFKRAELLVKVGVDLKSMASGNVGVVFPPDEFKTVARSPRDLVRHMQATTRRANETNEDRDDVTERTGRSAGHVLAQKMAAMAALSGTLDVDRDFLRKMYKELDSSWIAHYMSKNLERHRVRADEMIHDTADVAAINMNYGSQGVARLHNGIKKRLYGGNRSHAQISEQWQSYIELVGKYIGMRLVKIDVSTQLCQDELVAYQPYLDRKPKAA